jgi:hypothetical protein
VGLTPESMLLEQLLTGKILVTMAKVKCITLCNTTQVTSTQISLSKVKCMVTPKIRWAAKYICLILMGKPQKDL